MIRLVVYLIVFTVAVDLLWPQSARDQAAASMAHAYCQQRPAPKACQPGGHPSDALAQAMGLYPSPNPAQEVHP